MGIHVPHHLLLETKVFSFLLPNNPDKSSLRPGNNWEIGIQGQGLDGSSEWLVTRMIIIRKGNHAGKVWELLVS